MKKKFNKKESLAISQILILILGTLAFSYAIGSGVGFVSGQEGSIFSFTFISDGSFGKLGETYKSDYSQNQEISSNRYPTTELPSDISGFRFFRNPSYGDPQPTVVATNGKDVYYYSGTRQKWTKFKTANIKELNLQPSGAKAEEEKEEVGGAPTKAPLPAPGSPAWKKLFGEDEEGPEPGETWTEYEMRMRKLTETPEEEKEGLTWNERLDICSERVKAGEYKGTLNECMKELKEEKVGAGIGTSVFLKNLWKSAAFAAAAYGSVRLITSLIAPEAKGWYDPKTLSFSIGVGAFVGRGIYGAIKQGGRLAYSKLLTLGGMDPLLASGIWGIATAALTYALLIREKDQLTVNFECLPWQPDTGGNNCDKCNKQGILPCSEYQCRSLGQGCQLLNDEESGEALCVWVNRQDTEYPTVRALDSALLDDYSYVPNNKISPPDRGVLISYNKTTSTKVVDDKKIGCIPAFTPLRFGVTTLDKDGKGEPAICKIDPIRKDNFDGMSFYMGGSSTFKYNHTQTLSLPGADALGAEGIEIGIGGGQELYVRCQDANGNSNPATFVFKFCIDEGPDTTPPLITATDVLNDMPVAAGTQSIDINVYINEPVPTVGGCKWSYNDQPYENMEKNMDCSAGDSLGDMNPQGLFTCKTTLDGLKDGLQNRFYFRCQDLKGNVNVESYKFTLVGSQPLVIDSAAPNGTTIKDSTDPVKVTLNVKTSAGYKEGEATCYYSDTGNEKDYVMFFTTVSYQHFQDLWLPEGSHTYYVKCIDLGGNADYKKVSFRVETDTEPPVVVRAYHEETYLKIITNEKAECVYDVANCNYPLDDGIDMRTSDGISHFTDWATNRNFYIKCKDAYGKQPNRDQCSITVRPSQI